MARHRQSVPKDPQHGSGRPVCGRGLLLLAALVLAGCSTTQIDQIPHSIGGLPEGAPARPAVQPAFPAVHDMPPARAQPLLDEEQQKRLERDLIRVRDRNTGQSKNP
jgi:hypothetical protein